MAVNKIGYTHSFKIHVPNFLEEIWSAGLANNSGVLKVPFVLLARYLNSVSERCAQINDPVLNKLMCEMALYEQANPDSENYDSEMINQVMEQYEEFKKEQSKVEDNE